MALAGIYTVNSTTDAVDFDGGVGVCETALGNGICTLRAAIQTANAQAGADTVVFDIPDTDSGYTTSGSESWWRISPTSALPTITGAGTVIDGTTQAANYGSDTNSLGPEIEVNGLSAGAGVNGFNFSATADNSALRGLMITRFIADGVRIVTGADGITVADNWIGTDGSGLASRGNGDDGIEILGADNIIDTNVVVNSGDEGINLTGAGATDNTIIGNIIGLEPDGSSGSGNGDVGIAILTGATGTTVGGLTAAERNVISLNYEGIEVNTSGNVITGNYIGTDASGTLDRGNRSDDGVELQNGNNNSVGGTAAGAGNLIAYNQLRGVTVKAGTGNRILGNNIHSNNSMGIDLSDDGVTPNDGTTGALPNIGMDYPVFTATALTGSDLHVEGYVGTSGVIIAGTHTIEVFRADDDGGNDGEVEVGDGLSVGHGEGRWYIDRCLSAADGTFNCDLTVPGTVALASGDFVTSTATDTVGNTSEFGANFIVTPQTCPTVTTTADSGGGSLRSCIDYANSNVGTTIVFDIPDTDPGYTTSGSESWWRISPASILPTIIASGTVIDGTTQAANYGSDTNSLGPEIEIDGSGAGAAVDGLMITGGNGTIRGLAMNRFGDDGIVLSTLDGNVVEGCYIGIDPTGTIDLGNVDHGIIIRDGSDNNTIGGPGVGNVISGNGDRGVRILSSSGNVIQDNLIGTDASGTIDIGNTTWGVHLEGSFGNSIGGQNAGEGNIIAFNGLDGVFITGAGANQNLISGNSIFSNAGMGVDLAPDGVTSNNGTTGALPNIGMDYPVLTAAALSLTNLHVEGYVGTSAVKIAGTHTIEVFKILDDGGSNGEVESGDGRNVGHGEGQFYIDSCVTAADGTFTCDLIVPGTVTLASGDFVTATATDPADNTSEFGANLIVTPNTCPTVTNTADSGGGSLRSCIDYANVNPGTTISFNIANSDPAYITSGGNSWWRISPGGALPDITAAGTVIDGTTQAANYGSDTNSLGPEIEIDGSGAGAGASGLTVNVPGGTATVRHLVVDNFSESGIHLQGGSTLVTGSYIGLEPDGNTLAGNNTSTTSYHGGVRIVSAGNTIGGTTAADRNVISGNTLAGIVMFSAAATGNQVLGNYIGTDAGGTLDRGNISDGEGIEIQLADSNTIGGTSAGARNVISGNASDGMEIDGSTNNVIQGNYIGTDFTGTVAIPNDRDGIDINSDGATGSTGNLVGGTVPGAGNLISGNTLNGVELRDDTVVGATTNNSILGNIIYGNGQLGIDLNPVGVTANDAGDGDIGPNALQNYPVITAVVSGGISTTVTGTLNSQPASTFRLEFYSTANPDPLGYGEGESFLGTTTVTTDGAGDTSFTVNFPTGLLPGDYVTATATGPTGSTSEFAANAVLPLYLVKQALLASDGSLITNSSTLPRGTIFRFLIYTENTGSARTDVSIQDVLVPAFAYSAGSLKVDNSQAVGASVQAIYSAVNGTASLTDVIDADVASVAGSTIDVGDRFVGNGPLDIAANRIWSLLFTVRMQ
jgi:CSLREA domain-containing protein